MKITLKNQPKSRFTRMCIGEAIIILLKTTEYEDLKISAIVKRAGVSRMSFYRYYESPKEALKDYLQLAVEDYLRANHLIENRTTWFEYEHILFSLKFFDRYRDYFMTMSRRNLHGILLEGVNRLMEEQFQPENPLNRYQMYAYSGALLNTFLKWEEGEKKEKVEEVARVLYELYH